MPDFLFLRNYRKYSLEQVKRDINLSGNLSIDAFEKDEYLYAITYHKNAPLKGKRIFSNESWVILFAGDLPDYDFIPYNHLIELVEGQKFELLKNFNGIFSILLHNRKNNKIYFISDRRSQYPAFYFFKNNYIVISTALSLFVKIIDNSCFNNEFLFDYLFFNLAVTQTTFLNNVYKMPPASYLVYDLNSESHYINYYSGIFLPKEKLLEGKESFKYALKIFQERLSKYFPGDYNFAFALSGGWDSRTNLAFASNLKNCIAYSYGTQGSYDLVTAKALTDKLKIKFKEIDFNEDFVGNLPELSLDTVYYSSGQQGILRSTLLYVYKSLSYFDPPIDIIISGINYDALFRGHFAILVHNSPNMGEILSSGKIEFDPHWKIIFRNCYADFTDAINTKLDYLKKTFGEFNSSFFHLSYFNYLIGPNYYDGEIKIADNFSTIRVPAWDNKIIDLAYSIKESTLSYSQLTEHKRGSRDEMELQSYLISNSSQELSKIPLGNTKPNIVLSGETAFQLYKFLYQLIQRIKNRKTAYTEEWNNWLNNVHASFIDSLIFSKESLIREYINKDYLSALKFKRDFRMIGKLATIEIILRLIKNRWKKFW